MHEITYEFCLEECKKAFANVCGKVLSGAADKSCYIDFEGYGLAFSIYNLLVHGNVFLCYSNLYVKNEIGESYFFGFRDFYVNEPFSKVEDAAKMLYKSFDKLFELEGARDCYGIHDIYFDEAQELLSENDSYVFVSRPSEDKWFEPGRTGTGASGTC